VGDLVDLAEVDVLPAPSVAVRVPWDVHLGLLDVLLVVPQDFRLVPLDVLLGLYDGPWVLVDQNEVLLEKTEVPCEDREVHGVQILAQMGDQMGNGVLGREVSSVKTVLVP
jgi:hypothetical protein